MNENFRQVVLDGFFLALMEAVSFCGGVHHKRYSGQQEIAPEKLNYNILNYKFQLVKALRLGSE